MGESPCLFSSKLFDVCFVDSRRGARPAAGPFPLSPAVLGRVAAKIIDSFHLIHSSGGAHKGA